MTDLIDTTEMYLKSILELEEDGVVALRARIAERLGHSGPTVSQTVARMERDGLVTLQDDRQLEFTEHGRRTAIRVMRKHRLAERLLVDVIGLDLPHVHEEACRWEHVMSDEVEQRILKIIEEPLVSPYGNPIPGLSELDADYGTTAPAGGRHLVDALREGPEREVVVVRIGEPAQVEPDVLGLLGEAGVAPGSTVRAQLQGDRIVVTGTREGDTAVSLPRDVASHIFVQLD
ncbi:metal-dependent transcriptional regulator [Ornithinimicrobium sp. F0845]|uniref:metal-dependent transcriptional regulator n=1 Tax=Ornithinimicrobium sp. F0845 TaxID=2926412 RepID=UPI001FF128C5|nr:metal-dependent transcriptional regulator [Ornithinimicrobium sp. F0845]MCK0113647.1 metal-dependent transcriptional regulator [Ornithinimicrobium sp. F0845]